MKVYWRNTADGRSTILSFDDKLHEIFNQQRRAEALIYGIVQIGGRRIFESETYDSIEISATYPYTTTLTVFLTGQDQARPVVKVEFEARNDIGLGPGYVTEVTDLATGQVFDDTISVNRLAWEVVHSVMVFLTKEIPGINDSFWNLYQDCLTEVKSELDPEFWTIKRRHLQFSPVGI